MARLCAWRCWGIRGRLGLLIAGLLSVGTSRAFAVPLARLLGAEPGGIRFVVDVPEIALKPAREDSTLSTLAIQGFDSEGAAGEAGLPQRVILVAVPPRGRVTAVAVGSAIESRSGVRLEILPAIPRPAPGRAPEIPPAALARTAASRPLARLLDVSWMRDQRVARIALAPAAWDPASGTLTVRHRIEVSVSFESAPAGAPTSSPDAFEPLYRASLVNYDQGRAWRRPARERALPARGRPGGASLFSSAMPASIVPDTSLFAGRGWVKIAIPQTGFYRVQFAQLIGTHMFNPSGSAPNRTHTLEQLRLFTWPGVPVLPESTYCDSCGYHEVAIRFEEYTPNDTLDSNKDAFTFFALGPSDWANLYDPSQPDTMFVNHPYETRNFVYLTLDSTSALPGVPARIASDSTNVSLDDTLTTPIPATFPGRVHREVDDGSEYWPDAAPIVGRNADGTYRFSGETWEKFFWVSLLGGHAAQESFDLPGLDASSPVRLRLRDWGLSFQTEGSTKSIGMKDHALDVSIQPAGGAAIAFPRRQWNGLTSQTFDTTATAAGFAETGNTFLVSVPAISDPDPRFSHFDRSGLAWLDAFYRERFVPSAQNELAFESDLAGGTWLYRIGPFTAPAESPPRIFDLTDPLAPVEIRNAIYHPLSAGSFELVFKRTESGQRRYRIITDSSFLSPATGDVFDAPGSSRENLRKLAGSQTGADFLVIYYDGFKVAADTLLAWRRTHLPGVASPKTFSVPISAIYDQFSGGRTDPAAIRNFLRAAFTHWNPRPAYVTLLGDASYDFKNLTGQAPAGLPGCLVPSYENGFDDLVQRQFATDDWLLNIDDPTIVIPDFYGGRIPADDETEAMTYIRDKLLPYERAAPLGEWRDRVMLIADDNMQGALPDPLFWQHLEQTTALDEQGLPPEFDRSYVYLNTYPTASNETKPGARTDIVNGLNDGVVLANYIGHGSPYQLADESVFLDLDAKALTNKARPTIFVSASCDVGKFDNPAVKSMGEDLVLNPNGGAVAVISATELAFSNLNGNLNLELFQNLFARDSTSGQFETPLSKALLAAKTGIVNSQKYQVMGDAAVKPVFPRFYVQSALEDSAGQPVTQARRGQLLRVTGKLLDRPGGSPLVYDGVSRLLIEDSAPIDTADCFGGCVTYRFRAAPVFRGDVAVQGGSFTTRFVMPMNAALGPLARARLYDELTQGSFATDGVGSAPFAVTPGTLPTGDREGPRIALSFRGGATSVRPDALLRVDLYDQSGILITGHSPQNDIIVTLDEDSNRRADITSTFRYSANSYQSGTAYFQLPGLSIGSHRVQVSAADNLAAGIAAPDHRSSATLDFEVTASPTLRVTRAILFPNPTRSGRVGGGGQFVIDAPGDSVNVLLRIYTVAGRLVRSLESHGGLAQVQIPWDGLDAEGEPLARGTYLFKAQVYPRDPGGGSTARGRAQAEGRLVIVGP